MKEFSCGDLIPGCGTRFYGSTDEQILAQVAQHARRDHGLASVPSELVSQVTALIRPAA